MQKKSNAIKLLQVSTKNPRYLTDANGKTYLPIGLNLCFVRGLDKTEKEVLHIYRRWFDSFAKNGGNYTRIWLGVPFFNVMPEQAGKLSEKNLNHIRAVLKMAEERNIKVKLTLEHFRRTSGGHEAFPGIVSFTEPVYKPYANSMQEYCESEQCRKFYLQKAKYIADATADSPALVAVELWNEINCIGPVNGYVGKWSDYMIPKLQKLFPKQMILQNIGSYSAPDGYTLYDYMGKMKNNAFMQVHRYLDPGAELDVCRGPMDIIAASSIQELLRRRPDQPAITAEIGAVEARHARRSDLYEVDREGTLLHDALFAPFFAGSAGCGQFWHWEYYVEKWNLWYHFARFAEAVKGVDPVAENFEPYYTETARLRVYGLRGKNMDLLWCRDKASSWQSELKENHPAELLHREVVFIETPGKVDFYLPWENKHIPQKITNQRIILPDFRRSIVIRISKTANPKGKKFSRNADSNQGTGVDSF